MTKQNAIDKIKCFPNWNLDDEWLLEDEMQELSEIAIDAIEKQIPKKPIRVIVGTHDSTDGCSVCKRKFYEKFAFCPTCGNAVDWS